MSTKIYEVERRIVGREYYLIEAESKEEAEEASRDPDMKPYTDCEDEGDGDLLTCMEVTEDYLEEMINIYEVEPYKVKKKE